MQQRCWRANATSPALALRDAGLAFEVLHLSERLEEMKDHLQLWVLRAGANRCLLYTSRCV